MQIGEREGFDHAEGFTEFGIGLARKAGHDIGSDSGGGHDSMDLLNFFAIMPGTIFAVHAAQDGIATGLHGHMRMFGNAG